MCETHCVAPVGVEPALGTGPHVAVLHVGGPQVHVALFIRNKVSQVTDAAHLSRPLPVATWNWALWRHTIQSNGVMAGNLKKLREVLTRTAGWFAVTYCRPLRANLPLTADLQLAGAGRLWPLQVLAVAGVDIECAVGVNLTTQDLAMLHAEPTGLAAFWPLSNVPAAQRRQWRHSCMFLSQWNLWVMFRFS